MKKFILAALCMIALHPVCLSQSNELDRKLEKAKKYVKENKLEDAEKYLVKLLNEYPAYGEGWDYLANVRYQQYIDSKNTGNLFGNLKIVAKDENGKEDDSLTQAVTKMLSSIKPGQKAYNKYIYTLRKGSLLADDAWQSSALLRSNFVDPDVDTNVSKKALKYFTDAEEEFAKENYDDAAKLYKRAIEAQPDFYKASLYLGDVYYFQKQYYEAEKYFRQAVNTFPNLIEPRKYLIDTYVKQRRFEEAMEEAINGSAVYPDATLLAQLDQIVYMQDKKMDIKKTMRPVFPNKNESDSALSDANRYVDEDSLVAKNEWVYYKGANDKIKSFCNSDGKIIKQNTLTKSGYLEVYSWEEMLANSKSPDLEEARKMQSLGYLDCYVLVTCYHFDLYPQYKDFVASNSQRIREYYKKLIR